MCAQDCLGNYYAQGLLYGKSVPWGFMCLKKAICHKCSCDKTAWVWP